MINNATLTNSSYKMRLAQDIALYLAEIGMDIPGWDDEAGKRAWLEDPIWQPTRVAIETIMGVTDYAEQWLAINLAFEPLVGELFRSGFMMQVAAANADFVTPAVISAGEIDYERNLANAIDFAFMLVSDPQHATHNKALLHHWITRHGALADKAAEALRPIWSQPHSKPLSWDDARTTSHERQAKILGELGLGR
jgi:propane monooxygenase small subunit